jgi:5-methylcytosine-specific restriction enzyme A
VLPLDWSNSRMKLADRYAAALRTLKPRLRPIQVDVLNALYFAPKRSLTASAIAKFLGRDLIEVNGALGRLGHAVRDLIGTHPDGFADGEYQWFHILAEGERRELGFVWILRPAVASAMEATGLVALPFAFPEEISHSESLYEGSATRVLVNSYERNPVARARCVEVYGETCAVCRFNFRARYGPMAAGYIHVHHLQPLGDDGTFHEVDPIRDLRPICPNCHAVLHLRNPPYSIDEVKAMLRRKSVS